VGAVLEYPLEDGLALINKAVEKQTDQKIWERWLVDYAKMSEETFVSFTDYKRKLAPQVSRKPKEDIIAMVEDIRRRHGKESEVT
jgi:predicted metal-dependent hydrolase